ncbi:MAG: hypothetical protein IMW89_05725 [Ktedonobacteraceae bacterium]|nr:hypothetical protein [Ktedonobacteraceae bacterium]
MTGNIPPSLSWLSLNQAGIFTTRQPQSVRELRSDSFNKRATLASANEPHNA